MDKEQRKLKRLRKLSRDKKLRELQDGKKERAKTWDYEKSHKQKRNSWKRELDKYKDI